MPKSVIELGLLISALVLIASEGYTQQEHYIWVDENGVKNYSERAPSGHKSTHVTENKRFGYTPKPSAETHFEGSKATNRSKLLATPADPDELIAEEKAKFEAELSAEKKQNCEAGKKNLARLETYARIKVLGEDGEYRHLTA